MKLDLKKEIEVPQGLTATATKDAITVKGPKAEISRSVRDPLIKIKLEKNIITLSSKKATKRQKRVMNSFAAHIQNMIKGAQEPYQYKMKICSGHFPMNVSISGEQLIIKNFLGEKSPRTLKLKKNVNVKIDGEFVIIEGPDKDLAGQMASDIEQLTRKSNRDLRVFQDGIYLTEKAGKKVFEE